MSVVLPVSKLRASVSVPLVSLQMPPPPDKKVLLLVPLLGLTTVLLARRAERSA
jgi:hypothetical protein